ncbi:MAG TPA: hypothetical protein VFX59_23960, partial [Polyangiales bacterium]|nr:hypothetical protein [Polyangiales bacterium]
PTGQRFTWTALHVPAELVASQCVELKHPLRSGLVENESFMLNLGLFTKDLRANQLQRNRHEQRMQHLLLELTSAMATQT